MASPVQKLLLLPDLIFLACKIISKSTISSQANSWWWTSFLPVAYLFRWTSVSACLYLSLSITSLQVYWRWVRIVSQSFDCIYMWHVIEKWSDAASTTPSPASSAKSQIKFLKICTINTSMVSAGISGINQLFYFLSSALCSFCITSAAWLGLQVFLHNTVLTVWLPIVFNLWTPSVSHIQFMDYIYNPLISHMTAHGYLSLYWS